MRASRDLTYVGYHRSSLGSYRSSKEYSLGLINWLYLKTHRAVGPSIEEL